MPLRQVSELVVHVVEFENIVLARKGVYRVEFTADAGDGDSVVTPYATFCGSAPTCSRVGRRWIARSDEIMDGPTIRAEAGAFVTRCMAVRFNDERFELAEVRALRVCE